MKILKKFKKMNILAVRTNTKAMSASPEVELKANGVLLLGIVLILFQTIDGIFTSIGITRWGIEVEGNPMLRVLMDHFGHIPALTILKIAAIAVVVALTLVAKHLPWVRNAMGAVTCIYFFTAIVPWAYILFINPPA